ncbi:hypothetical protein Fmac_021935 [Flemingia macrophylla]|uniref:Pentatricopeptide repeat-containing protein n=1 Tax=Flemingia macrophylla TaxID=520843 RepID=A0ABD1LYC2_9FABA
MAAEEDRSSRLVASCAVEEGLWERVARFKGSTTESLKRQGKAWFLPRLDRTTGSLSSAPPYKSTTTHRSFRRRFSPLPSSSSSESSDSSSTLAASISKSRQLPAAPNGGVSDTRYSTRTPHNYQRIVKLIRNYVEKKIHYLLLLLLYRIYYSKIHLQTIFNITIMIRDRLKHPCVTVTILATIGMRIRSWCTKGLGFSHTTLFLVSERYVSAGKPHRAVNLFLSMHHHGCRQDLHSFNTILDILCKSKRVEMAHHLFKTLRHKFRADSVTYNTIANGYCIAKRTPMALKVLKEMVERGIRPTAVTYNTMLKGYFRNRQLKEAWEFYLEMKKRKCEIDVVTYTTVIHGFGVAGEVKKARRVFDEMVKEGVAPSVVTYNALIQVLCKKESVESAVVVFEEMVGEGLCVPNVTTYNVVIRGLCHAGDMERALGFVGRMEEHGLRASVQTYNVLIRYFCDAGEIERGLEVFEKMGGSECLPNLDTYNVLICAMFVRKKSEDLVVAGKLLMEMVDRGFVPTKFTFNRVLNGLVLTGNQEFAKEILRKQSECSRVVRRLKL